MSVKDYLALRKKLGTSLSINQITSDPGSYIGKVFEIRGTVSGSCKNASGENMMIISSNSGSNIISTDKLPVDSPGAELACLVKIGEGSVHSLSDLRLVACAFNVDLRQLEEYWAKVAEAKAARAKSSQQPAAAKTSSSGQVQVLTSEDLLRIYTSAIKGFNRKLTDKEADTIARSILGFSYRFKVDPRLVCAVILTESRFKICATSRCGAAGLGQLMPSTAAGLGVSNPYDPVANIYGSVRYIRSMMDRTSSNVVLALAAYNAGPGAVKKHGGVPPYKETQNYVRRVVSVYRQLCGVK